MNTTNTYRLLWLICALFIFLYPVNPILFAIGLVGWPVVSLAWIKREVAG